MTQTELAEASGRSKLTVSLVENGKVKPSVGTTRVFAEALGVSVGMLLDTEEILQEREAAEKAVEEYVKAN